MSRPEILRNFETFEPRAELFQSRVRSGSMSSGALQVRCKQKSNALVDICDLASILMKWQSWLQYDYFLNHKYQPRLSIPLGHDLKLWTFAIRATNICTTWKCWLEKLWGRELFGVCNVNDCLLYWILNSPLSGRKNQLRWCQIPKAHVIWLASEVELKRLKRFICCDCVAHWALFNTHVLAHMHVHISHAP